MHQYESVDLHFDRKYAPAIFLCDPAGSTENLTKDTQIDVISDTTSFTFTLTFEELTTLYTGIRERIDLLLEK